MSGQPDATRQAIADALNGVDGIHGYPARPDTVSEGDAWPQWGGAEPKAYAWEDSWNVFVVMPQQDDVTADRFADRHRQAIADALRPVIYVDRVQPVKIDVSGGSMYAVMFTGRE